MTMEAHLMELERKHQALENEIAEAMKHPSTDVLQLAEMKRRKLQLKEQIAQLRGGAGASVH